MIMTRRAEFRGSYRGPHLATDSRPHKCTSFAEARNGERTKGNTAGETRPGCSAGSGVSSELGRVRQLAQRDREARFTALLHHVSLERLVLAYWDLSPKVAAPPDREPRMLLKTISGKRAPRSAT
jgi:RNA-directed DNA polymerase